MQQMGCLQCVCRDGVGLGDPARKGAKLYLVKWCGLPEAEATWEPAAHLTPALLAYRGGSLACA